MTKMEIADFKADLVAQLEALEARRAKITRQLKAVDVLLEEADQAALVDSVQGPIPQLVKPLCPPRKPPSHAVRFSARTTLIAAVRTAAQSQAGPFTSTQLLKALQSEYPELRLTETKHISRPLADLVKDGVLILERKREGGLPNLYRYRS